MTDHDRAAQLVAGIDAYLALGRRDEAIELARSQLECAVMCGRTEAALRECGVWGLPTDEELAE